MQEREATWTFDEEARARWGLYWYSFRPKDRMPGPYKTQRHVMAIVDIADDGTLAGVELVEDMPPPPARAEQKDAK